MICSGEYVIRRREHSQIREDLDKLLATMIKEKPEERYPPSQRFMSADRKFQDILNQVRSTEIFSQGEIDCYQGRYNQITDIPLPEPLTTEQYARLCKSGGRPRIRG